MSFYGIMLFTVSSRGKALQAVGLVACAALMLLYCYFTAASKSSSYWLEAKSCNAIGLVNALHTNVAVR